MICPDCLRPPAAPPANALPGAVPLEDAPPLADAPGSRCPRCGRPRAFVEVGAVPYSVRQRLRLLEHPLMFAAAALALGVMLTAGLARSFSIFSLTALVLTGLMMVCAIAAGITGGDALDDFKLGGAKVRLTRLENLSSGKRRQDVTRYWARFDSLPPLEISLSAYRRLREGERYWVTYSPHSATCWDIQPE